MKTYILKRSGKSSVLKMTDVPEPVCQPGQVCIKISHIGLNYAEILSRKGLYGWAPKKPYIPGMEATGIIEATGNQVDPNRIGERVNIGTQYGCYAEKICVPSLQALPVIPAFTTEENAAFVVNYMTAWVGLFCQAKIQAGEKLLVTAAAGGVGSAVIQLAAKAGAEVYALAGSPAKIEFVKKLGATDGISYRNSRWSDELEQRIGKVDVVYEMVGGNVYKQCLKLLNPLGRMAVFGFASLDYKLWNPFSLIKTLIDIPRANISYMTEKAISVMSAHLGFMLDYPDLVLKIYQEMSDFVKRHQIRPVVGKIFPFDQLPQAHQYIESRQSMGKVIVRGL